MISSKTKQVAGLIFIFVVAVLQAEPVPKVDKPKSPAVDLYGDPLPEGAIARLGTLRFRHGSYVRKLVYSPDGKQIAATSYDGTLRIWDTATGKELHRLLGKHGGTNWSDHYCYSADGKVLTAAVRWNGVGQWDTASGRELVSPTREQKNEYCFGISPDHSMAVYVTFFPPKLWMRDIATDRLIHEVDLPAGAGADSLSFSPDSRLLAVQGQENHDLQVRIVDVNTGKVIHVLKTEKENDYDYGPSLVIDSKGQYLAALTKRHNIRVWDLKTLNQVFELAAEPSLKDMAFMPGSSRLVTISMTGQVQIWDVAAGKEIRKFAVTPSHQTIAVAASPDGKTISVGAGGMISFWDAESGKEIGPYAGHVPHLHSLQFLNGHRQMRTFDGRQLAEWDTYSGRVRRRQADDLLRLSFRDGIRQTYNGKMWYLKDKNENGTVVFYDADTLKEVNRFATGLKDVHSVWFSPDERLRIATGRDATVRIWRLPEEQLIFDRKVSDKKLPYDYAYVAHAFNGKVLATYAYGPDSRFQDDRVRFYEIPSGRELPSLTVDPYFAGVFRFTSDGRKLVRFVTAYSDRNRTARHYISTYNLKSHKEHIEYVAGDIGIGSSPDECVIVSRGPDNQLLLLEKWSMQVRATVAGHSGVESYATFSATSDLMATTSSDSTALIWDITGLAHPNFAPMASLSSRELETHWITLADREAATAFASMKILMAAPKPTIAIFQNRLRPAERMDEKRISRLIADFDSNVFDTREKAVGELSKAEGQAERLLLEALSNNPSLESKRRIERVLDKLDKPVADPEKLRTLRAIEVLEHIGDKDAMAVLETLAKGAPAARETEEAKASLGRLAKAKGGN